MNAGNHTTDKQENFSYMYCNKHSSPPIPSSYTPPHAPPCPSSLTPHFTVPRAPLYPLLSCPAPFMHSSPLFQGPSVTNSAALTGVGATHRDIIYQGTQPKKTDLPPPATMTAKGSSSTSLFVRARV